MIDIFEKLVTTKVFRDPIYGNINVDYKIIDDLIDTKEFQRLRRIKQLAGLSLAFHSAEHSRFTHSLGAYEMALKIINNCNDVKSNLSNYEQLLLLISALLHDVGHGPFSHAFEKVTRVCHELMTIKIIESKTEINSILSKYENLVEDVISVIGHKNKFPVVESLVSSQVDVDRLDYLVRDSYNAGVEYGTIDYNRIISSIKIIDNKIVFKASGAYAIEAYLISRYHMYLQIYFHPVARSFELLLQSIYKRIIDLNKTNYKFECSVIDFLNVIKNKDINSYLFLDDYY
ncbi:MAG: HD domain-containing protein, partial [Anaeroplasmataceae bacterium]